MMVVDAWENELKLIKGQLQRGRLVIFLGADLDKDLTGIPSRQQISNSLALSENMVLEQPLSTVAQQVLQHGNRFLITSFLREQMESTDKTPQTIHHQIVDLVLKYNLKIIITTTYDSMLEIAFRHSQVAINTVVMDNDLRFINQDLPLFIKLHGDWRQPASLTITQQDENQLLHSRVLGKQEIVNEVKRAFRLNTMLFIGLNLRDMAMTSLFDEFAGNQFQLPAFAVWSDLTAREVNAWRSNRGLTIIDTEPSSFLQTLQQ